MIMHLGKLVSDLDAKQAAHQNRIVVCLQKRGSLRENDVRLYNRGDSPRGSSNSPSSSREPIGARCYPETHHHPNQ